MSCLGMQGIFVVEMSDNCKIHNIYPFIFRPMLSSSIHGGYRHTCESPVSEGADYATESDLEHSHDMPSGNAAMGIYSIGRVILAKQKKC